MDNEKVILSFGAGVNSIALYLYLIEKREEFEPVFADHGAEYPETYEYLELFNDYISQNNLTPITRLVPKVTRDGVTYTKLYDFCKDRCVIPQPYPRWCTGDLYKVV